MAHTAYHLVAVVWFHEQSTSSEAQFKDAYFIFACVFFFLVPSLLPKESAFCPCCQTDVSREWEDIELTKIFITLYFELFVLHLSKHIRSHTSKSSYGSDSASGLAVHLFILFRSTLSIAPNRSCYGRVIIMRFLSNAIHWLSHACIMREAAQNNKAHAGVQSAFGRTIEHEE